MHIFKELIVFHNPTTTTVLLNIKIKLHYALQNRWNGKHCSVGINHHDGEVKMLKIGTYYKPITRK